MWTFSKKLEVIWINFQFVMIFWSWKKIKWNMNWKWKLHHAWIEPCSNQKTSAEHNKIQSCISQESKEVQALLIKTQRFGFKWEIEMNFQNALARYRTGEARVNSARTVPLTSWTRENPNTVQARWPTVVSTVFFMETVVLQCFHYFFSRF